MSDEQRLAEIEQRLTEMETMIENILARNETNDRALLSAGMGDLRGMVDQFRTVVTVVLGDDDLGIEPLRPMVVRLQSQYDRAKWFAGSLVTTNAGTIAAWISTLLK